MQCNIGCHVLCMGNLPQHEVQQKASKILGDSLLAHHTFALPPDPTPAAWNVCHPKRGVLQEHCSERHAERQGVAATGNHLPPRAGRAEGQSAGPTVTAFGCPDRSCGLCSRERSGELLKHNYIRSQNALVPAYRAQCAGKGGVACVRAMLLLLHMSRRVLGCLCWMVDFHPDIPSL